MTKKKKNSQSGYFKRYGNLLPYLLIAILVFFIYRNTFESTFHFDDEASIIKNEQVKSLSNFSSLKSWTDINARPLTHFTFAVNYSLGGLNPTGYHIFNVIIHILTSILVYILAKTIIGLCLKELSDKNKIILASGVALLFAVHTIQVMAVTYISQRLSILAALFYVLSVIIYIRSRQYHIKNGLRTNTILLYFTTVLTAILAIMSKQNAATLPLMWWFIELFFIRDTKQKPAKKYLITYGTIILIGLLTVILSGILPRESEEITRLDYLVTQFKVYSLYFLLLFYIKGFNIDHGINVSDSLFGTYEIIGLLIIAFFIFLAFKWFKKYRILSFGITWFFLTMLVESSIIPIRDLMFEHRLYLPFFGFAFSLTFGIYLILKEKIRQFSIVISVIILVLAISTYFRNLDWKTNKTIWESSLDKTPDNKRALVYVGKEVLKTNPNRAFKLFNRSVEIDPNYYYGWFNLGLFYYNLKKYKDAAKCFTNAIELSTRHHKYLYFLRGVSYLQLKKYKLSLENFNTYLSRHHKNVDAYIYRGEVNYHLKRYRASAKDFIKTLELDPGREKIYLNLVEIYYRLKDVEKVKHYVKISKQKGLKVPKPYLNFIKQNTNAPG